MVGPVPWGTLKQSLNEALQTLGWEAKVLQAMPAGKDFKGVLWRVHALSPPPTSILHLTDGEAVITRVDVPSQSGQSFCNAVLGSNASVKYVKKGNEQGDRGVDQVFANDPWAAYKAPVVPPMHVPDALASLEQKVLSSVIAKLPRESMEVDGEGCLDRVGVLEAKVKELHEQQSRMQTVIQENGNNQQAQMVQMQSQFQARHLRLEKVVGEQSTKLSNLTCQFSQQLNLRSNSHILTACSNVKCRRLKICFRKKHVMSDGAPLGLRLTAILVGANVVRLCMVVCIFFRGFACFSVDCLLQ